MEIKRIKDAPGYYIADNGFCYRRHKMDGMLHKLPITKRKSQYLVSIKVNDKFKYFSIGQLMARYFLNATGSFRVYRINKSSLNFKPSNLRVKYSPNANVAYDNEAKRIEVTERGSLTKRIFNSIMEAAHSLDINDSQIRLIVDTPKMFRGYLFKSVIE